MKKTTVSYIASLVAVPTFAVPCVSDVSYSQDPVTKAMTVAYSLSGESGIPILDIRTNGVSIGWSNLRGAYGDVHRLVQPGTGKKIYWYPSKAWPEKFLASGVTAVVRVYPENNPPDIMVVNCEGQYKGRAEAVQYFVSEAQLPEGSLNCPVYKTGKMAFRKVPAAGIVWRMGSPASEKGRTPAYETQRRVRLTSNYYLGVFEVTQAQYERFMGTNPSNFKTDGAMRPVENVSWADVRGGTSVWPGETRAAAYASVPEASFLGALRKHAGGRTLFDLPTEAQWEFACRAGTHSALYTGENLSGSTTSANLDRIGRYAGNDNGGHNMQTSGDTTIGTDAATSVVGTYLANGFGLYDMLGNVQELCLDWSGDYNGDEIDPAGPANDSASAMGICRGGAYCFNSSYVRSGARYQQGRSGGSRATGFRICVPLNF